MIENDFAEHEAKSGRGNAIRRCSMKCQTCEIEVLHVDLDADHRPAGRIAGLAHGLMNALRG
jgi:hypothetical protein